MIDSQNTPPTCFQQRRKRKRVKSSERGDGGRLESPPSQAGAWPSVQRCEMSALFFNIPASGGGWREGGVVVGCRRCERKPSDVSAVNLRGGHAGGNALTGI